jgi:hypothetical protein
MTENKTSVKLKLVRGVNKKGSTAEAIKVVLTNLDETDM